MKIQYTPVTSHVRFYKDDDESSYDKRVPYDGILTIQYLTDEIVYIFGAHAPGCLTPEVRHELHELLKSKGVKKLMYERGSKMVTRDL